MGEMTMRTSKTCQCDSCRDQRLYQGLIRLHEDLDQIEARNVIEGRERTLRNLYEQGFELDPIEEVLDTAELEDDAFERHVQQIRTRYQRDDGRRILYERHQAQRQAAVTRLTRRQVDQISRHAVKNGQSFSEAKAAVLGTAG